MTFMPANGARPAPTGPDRRSLPVAGQIFQITRVVSLCSIV
jgi:hypothetical protein